MNTLRNVIEPHAPRDASKVASLVRAYKYDEPVPAVVVLLLGDAPWALCGSHRLAALREMYAPGSYIDQMGEILVVDGERVYERANAAQREALDRLLASRYSPADDLSTILPLLPRRAKAALADQI